MPSPNFGSYRELNPSILCNPLSHKCFCSKETLEEHLAECFFATKTLMREVNFTNIYSVSTQIRYLSKPQKWYSAVMSSLADGFAVTGEASRRHLGIHRRAFSMESTIAEVEVVCEQRFLSLSV